MICLPLSVNRYELNGLSLDFLSRLKPLETEKRSPGLKT